MVSAEKIKKFFFRLQLLAADLAAFNVAFFLSWWVRPYVPFLTNPNIPLVNYQEIILLANFVFLLLFFLMGLYQMRVVVFNAEEAYKIFVALFSSSLIIIATTYLSRPYAYSRFVIVFTFGLAVLLICLVRFLLNKELGFLRKTGFENKRTLIIGAGVMGTLLAQKIRRKPEYGYKVLGFLDDDPAKIGQKIEGHPVIGGLKNLPEIIELEGVKEIFVALPAGAQQKVINLAMKYEEVEFKIVPNLLELITEPISFAEFKDVPLITVRESSVPVGYDQFKRLFDLIAAWILLVGLSPFWLLVMIFIKLTSPGPVFFRQKRIGRYKKIFTCYKFRSMVEKAEQLKPALSHLNIADGPIFKIPHDPRATPIGRFLRRTCLDELPQLVNVIKGEMSLVGPRPPLPEELKVQPELWPENRFRVRPGMTGLWQVSGRHELNFSKTVRLDLYYIKHRSLLMDLEIILKTIPAILFS